MSDNIIDDYTTKNCKLEIVSYLNAVNHGLDFNGFLDTDQALGAKNLVDIIRMLDENGCTEWNICGWYADDLMFGEDYSGKVGDTTFINAAYIENEERLDDLWMHMPCLVISASDGRVSIGVDNAPYFRQSIMEPMYVSRFVIDNERGSLFPGGGAELKAASDRYFRRDKDGRPNEQSPFIMIFRMPVVFHYSYMDGDVRKDGWRFNSPDERDMMFDMLSELCRRDDEE